MTLQDRAALTATLNVLRHVPLDERTLLPVVAAYVDGAAPSDRGLILAAVTSNPSVPMSAVDTLWAWADRHPPHRARLLHAHLVGGIILSGNENAIRDLLTRFTAEHAAALTDQDPRDLTDAWNTIIKTATSAKARKKAPTVLRLLPVDLIGSYNDRHSGPGDPIEIHRFATCSLDDDTVRGAVGKAHTLDRALATRSDPFPDDVWAMLISSPHGDVRIGCAKNRRLPEQHARALLAAHPTPGVATALAEGTRSADLITDLVAAYPSDETYAAALTDQWDRYPVTPALLATFGDHCHHLTRIPTAQALTALVQRQPDVPTGVLVSTWTAFLAVTGPTLDHTRQTATEWVAHEVASQYLDAMRDSRLPVALRVDIASRLTGYASMSLDKILATADRTDVPGDVLAAMFTAVGQRNPKIATAILQNPACATDLLTRVAARKSRLALIARQTLDQQAAASGSDASTESVPPLPTQALRVPHDDLSRYTNDDAFTEIRAAVTAGDPLPVAVGRILAITAIPADVRRVLAGFLRTLLNACPDLAASVPIDAVTGMTRFKDTAALNDAALTVIMGRRDADAFTGILTKQITTAVNT